MRLKPRAWLLPALALLLTAVSAVAQQIAAPVPLLKSGQPVDWWFVFKFNAEALPGCQGGAQRVCSFGGTPQNYRFSQQYAYASSAEPTLQAGGSCVGDGTTDPLGATFDEVYRGPYFYVVWNDQFYGDPMASAGAPWGHSKGLLAWNEAGEGLVLQVSTPSWPASGSATHPRQSDGNTLGCVADDDVLVSQHFFALKLSAGDIAAVLRALANSSVVSDPGNPQVVKNGGPEEIQTLVKSLGGKVSTARTATIEKLSSGVRLISKPSRLQVPPWQLVSALLDGQPLRAATWWSHPTIPTTTADTPVGCWDSTLKKPGAVEIATSGTWQGKTIGLQGIAQASGNHAKIGVTTAGHPYAVFGDLNQQGTLDGPACKSSQNGRGGMFYVVDNEKLAASVAALIHGESAPQ